MQDDKSKLLELITGPGGINVFTKYETDIINKAKQLKRLAFAIHAGRPDQHGKNLTKIVLFTVRNCVLCFQLFFFLFCWADCAYVTK